jgi:hypothetical protein
MGQFDLETDAALTQLNYDELSRTPGGEFVGIVSDLIALTGVTGPLAAAGGASNLLLKIRRLAGASYTSNLIYAVTAVRNDLRTLYERDQRFREHIESLPTDPKFAEAISALALRAMHTSVKDRLKRLARIVVNGVKENDLEPESLDDMMRAAVDLKHSDVSLLAEIYQMQSGLLNPSGWVKRQVNQRWNDLQRLWQEYWTKNQSRYEGYEGALLMGSFARLESLGLIAPGPDRSSALSPVSSCYHLLPEGKKFYERLQEIGNPG